MEINKGVSFYKNRSISDGEIMSKVGIYTYTKLNIKYPNIFEKMKESDYVERCDDGNIPPLLNLFISDDPIKMKQNIILAIYDDDENKDNFLIGSSRLPKNPLIKDKTLTFSWILFSFLIIIVLFIAFYFLAKIRNNTMK